MNLFALILWLCLMALPLPAWADGPSDNDLRTVRRQPPPGKAIGGEDRLELERGAGELGSEIQQLRKDLARDTRMMALLPDVEIFHKAVDWALRYDEIFNPTNEVPAAREMIRQGLERARQLRSRQPAWLESTGLVVRGYRSALDGSAQPYGLVIPASYKHGSATRHRLDLWFHGRGELLTELAFIRERQRNPGEFTPPDTLVLHPYSRYCNGQKLAGEVDAMEALAHVQSQYAIDENRLVVRGFSLGGAACWHLAVHHAGRWAAAAPGAGFSETPDFLKVFQNESLKPAWYERKLWHLYDCPDYALNLLHCPTVAYSGEKDRQKQAADVMATALAKEGIELVHVIGTNAGHQYTAEARAEINRRIDSIALKGREIAPRSIRFTTWTLKYPTLAWLTVEGLESHWDQARVEADVTGPSSLRIRTTNVTSLRLDIPAGHSPFSLVDPVQLELDGVRLLAGRPGSDRSFRSRVSKDAGGWRVVTSDTPEPGLRKVHGLQGPIDDAFMGSFLMVKPTGKAWTDQTAKWFEGEFEHALTHWRRHFRGDARVKTDDAVTEEDIRSHHLVLWGDPASNKLLARVLPELPVTWTREGVKVGDESATGTAHVPVMIHPNPLNPRRYVVLNSGFTFREYDYLNNARQVPKLPDFAVIDVSRPADSRSPGRVVTAGFFDEQWKWKPAPSAP